MLRGRWPLSCDCLDEETYCRARYVGLNTHSWDTAFNERETLMYAHTVHSAHICWYRQLDGDGDDEDAGAGRTPTAFR